MTVAGSDSLAGRLCEAFDLYRSGDEQAMSVIVDAATPLLWHTARGTGLDAATAEDVVQTTFVRLYMHAASISDPQAVLQWLLTTTRREAWALSRRGRRTDVSETIEDLDPVEPRADGADDVVVRSEEQRILWDHVRLLSERCQHLLRVIAVADRPDYAQIAKSLGMPVGSIGPTRGRCLAKLRIALLDDPKWQAS